MKLNKKGHYFVQLLGHDLQCSEVVVDRPHLPTILDDVKWDFIITHEYSISTLRLSTISTFLTFYCFHQPFSISSNMPVHPSEEEAPSGIYEKIAKDPSSATESTASDHGG